MNINTEQIANDLAEKIVEYEDKKRDMLNYTESLLKAEPQPLPSGQPAVISFCVEFPRSDKIYHYAATGVMSGHTGGPEEEPTQILWYLTGEQSKPRDWSDLIKFMWVTGLRTLEVLRSA